MDRMEMTFQYTRYTIVQGRLL